MSAPQCGSTAVAVVFVLKSSPNLPRYQIAGQTQGLNMTQQLENGIRFIDFRIMYTARPSTPNSDKDWYCLHGCQTEHTAITYLKEARAFLDAHPKEILTFWASRHGDNRPEGTDQYPDTTPAIRQAFFHQVEAVFEGLLFGASFNALSIAISFFYSCDYCNRSIFF